MASTKLKTANKHNSGFTLVEVLIALAIIAIAMAAALTTTGSQASNALYLKEKTIADWVALNELTQYKLAKSVTETGTTHGDSKMAGITWYWTREITPLANVKGVFEIKYKVYRNKSRKSSLVTVVSYSGNPQTTTGTTNNTGNNNSNSSNNTGSNNTNSSNSSNGNTN